MTETAIAPSLTEAVGALLFALAVVHTFSTKFFEHLAHTQPRHAGLWHWLGEVEVVFGFWALVLSVFMFATVGRQQAIDYLETRNFTEPLFVFAIMVIAATRPILQSSARLVGALSSALPLPSGVAMYWVVLAVVPLMGSFITEPAAMTLAALMLRDSLLQHDLSNRVRYGTLGVLFVNVSIGGTLTPFAAPPVLMVASVWHWDMAYMLTHFGWKAAVAVAVNASAAAWLFRKDVARMAAPSADDTPRAPGSVVAVHAVFLVGVVVFGHHPVVFMGLFLFFMGFASAYARHQDPLILREALLVAFFLAGLVVLGGQQAWWLKPLLLKLDANAVFFGATALTAITDNAALTYLGSLVEGLSDEFKVALVAGAVTGGGLTVIANAPNPAGVAILRGRFHEQTIHPLGLLLAALPPTLVAMAAFRLL
jgi:hypothetical protein